MASKRSRGVSKVEEAMQPRATFFFRQCAQVTVPDTPSNTDMLYREIILHIVCH